MLIVKRPETAKVPLENLLLLKKDEMAIFNLFYLIFSPFKFFLY